MATDLPHLPDITRLSQRVTRILGGNPGKFTLQGTNTYVLGTGRSRILIDTGEGNPAWRDSLSSFLEDGKATISTCILTHWHLDHIGGVKDVLSLAPDAVIYKHDPELGNPNYDKEGAVEWHDIADGQTFAVEGANKIRAFHCPGHTTDHMALILEDEDAMFTGDNVLGHGTAVFEDLAVYLSSLEKMEKQFSGRAYPGHGDVIDDGKGKIREYITHRRQREEQVLEVLGQYKDQGCSSMDIVKVIYKDYPENLWQPAEKGVIQVLEKLEGDGRVVRDKEKGVWKLSQKAAL
ncbi:MAG: hypothetical protein M1820_002668 [Bogoriella megaspora]|nr:MAG: hypothetical protein M1820_002668 [Bogoriella megaspora]